MNLRRLEEIGLNASGPLHPRFYDGWMLGFTPGDAKRGRSVNPFFGSSLPLQTKVDACRALYAAAGLPCIFRLTPFAQPAQIEEWLIAHGYQRFDDTLVMVRSLEDWKPDARPALRGAPRAVELDLFEWTVVTQPLRSLSDDQVRRLLDRQELLHLAGCGFVLRQRGDALAWGMAQVEDGWAGLYTIETIGSHRRAGLGRRVVELLLSWASMHGAAAAYLQVTADNAAAIPLYEALGFSEAYRYWYRALPEDVANERH